jgi:pyruvate dehydrogenase phosphatase
LGTDGLWDYVNDEEAVDIVTKCCAENQSHLAAQMLTERALEKAAKESNISVEELKQLTPGRKRRSLHDDTTVIVQFLK